MTLCISIHVDRPKKTRLPKTIGWDPALVEVTDRTGAVFGTTVLGLHEGASSRFMFFAGLAHRRDSEGKFIMPENPDDHLYGNDGKPLPDAAQRTVAAIVVDALGRRGDDHLFFSVDRHAYSSIKNWVDEKVLNPGKYHTVHDNCVKFVLKALAVGGLTLPTENVSRSVARLRRPEDVSSVIETITPTESVKTAIQPVLLTPAIISHLAF